MKEHKTGLEDMYVLKGHKKLRCGYTTGSCAAAAAKAAAWMLLTGEAVEETALKTPKGILLHLQVEEIAMRPGADGQMETVRCAVRKDGGDDPDATHGLLVFAEVSRRKEQGILIDGGEGVGRVTRPGLNQPVGNAAINSTPREMIRKETEEVCRRQGYRGGLKVMISIPGGEKIAAGTFNPRLGIRGGLSVLGTSGIVMPMSEEALVKSIEAEMRMLAAAGGEYLVVTPGNYGEAFAGQLPDLDLSCEMKCSNYVGETLDLAEELGIRGILFIAHIGKFIKVSGGIMNTHSRNADARAELMAAAAFRAGADRETVRKILDTGTTEEALDVLAASGQELLEHTMEEVCGRVQFYLNQRTKGSLETGAILFSSVRGKLGETGTVPELIRRINEQKARIKI
ncbi:MAG TPA: cobalamin biosynthesis protein CbiD [Candidatus Scatomonas merdigallinarum]|nr:cobalamin biosynthesis protein CbiD [Candidatus Scatomonas merdigallinarum]